MSDSTIHLPVGEDVTLAADLAIPPRARGLVLFAHGSGSSRHSPRNRFVASVLQRAGLATLLLDLLTSDEERADATTGAFRFDVGLLARRLGAVTERMADEPELRHLPIGYFGASTGAAAALIAAAAHPNVVGAVVSRGGRPDLAGAALHQVHAPTLLVVGGADPEVLALNRGAMRALPLGSRLEIVPGATHLFEEPGTLEQVAQLASAWFRGHLPTARPPRPPVRPGAGT
jgi:pimeloyl-ACP methyl ester carboxylesterase